MITSDQGAPNLLRNAHFLASVRTDSKIALFPYQFILQGAPKLR